MVGRVEEVLTNDAGSARTLGRRGPPAATCSNILLIRGSVTSTEYIVATVRRAASAYWSDPSTASSFAATSAPSLADAVTRPPAAYRPRGQLLLKHQRDLQHRLARQQPVGERLLQRWRNKQD